MLVLRPAAPGDLGAVVRLARELDSANLPADPEILEARIAASVRSFAARAPERSGAVYVFLLEDQGDGDGRVVGASLILAKHGTAGSPHYFLEVSEEERASAALGRRLVHRKLRLRASEDGPTEVGGLILDPAYRAHPRKCGKALSVVRFAYISAHPDRFEREVIAELLSPFEGHDHNLLWEAFGARFTGLSYREADRLCARHKGFIADLFPMEPVYATLLPEPTQRMIGEPAGHAIAAVRILEKVGFRWLNQVDPFDGGPYYGAARDAISSVRERRELVLPALSGDDAGEPEGPLALVSAEGALGFRATVVPTASGGAPLVSRECREALGVKSGDRVAVTPLP